MRRYGKPLPAKRDIKATLNFYSLAGENKMQVELTDDEVSALKIVCYAKYETYLDRVAHAASHGDNFQNPFDEAIISVINKIDPSPNVKR